MDLNLQDKHVLITGASQGIGRSAARAFAKEGANVSLIARDEDKLKTLLAELNAGKHHYLATDLSEPKAAINAVEEINEQYGKVHIVIHAIGGSMQIKDPYAALEDWLKVWQMNIGIAIEINNYLLPKMKQEGWGRAIHISSRVAVEYFGAPAYNAAKSYLNAYVTTMGRLLAADHVLVNAIMPSAIATEDNNWAKYAEKSPEEINLFLEQHQSIGRLGTGDDITPFLLLLASERNTFAAGSIISIDGGSK